VVMAGRKPANVRRVRLLAEAEILADKPDISDIDMVKELEKRGIKTTRQTVHFDRQNDLDSMSLNDIEKSKSTMIHEIDTLISIAYSRAIAGGEDSLRAMDKYDKLFNTKAKVLVAFEQAKMAANVEKKPKIFVTIGEPKLYKKEKEEKNETE